MNTREDETEPLGESPAIDTLGAINRAAELGMLAGADYAKALTREVFRANIDPLVKAFDDHDPGILRAKDLGAADDMYQCPRSCGFVGAEADWKRHLADKLADALAGA